MIKIVELSIFGEIFLFENNFTPQQLEKLEHFAIDFFQKRKKSDIRIEEFEMDIAKSLGLNLNRIIIDKVIAI
jgi:hypothetical protein